MSDVLEPLKRLEPEAISLRTKISLANVKKLLHRDFEPFSKVQFFGFISILEREYGLDLHALKEEYAAFDAVRQSDLKERGYVLKTPRKHRLGRWWLRFLMVALIIWVVYIFLPRDGYREAAIVEYSAISKAKERLEAVHQQALNASYGSRTSMPFVSGMMAESSSSAAIVLTNKSSSTQEADDLNIKVESNTTQEVSAAASSASSVGELVFIPTQRVWLGLIDAQSGQKSQQIIKSPYEVNVSKKWRGILGHGYVDVRVNGVIQSYRTPEKLWFVYENGTFEVIDSTLFLKLNGGKAW